MPGWLTIFLIALAAVAFFTLAMSLTLIFKGHHIDSEIATNRNMQRLGIKCAVQQAREESGTVNCHDTGCTGSCSSCDIERSGEQ